MAYKPNEKQARALEARGSSHKFDMVKRAKRDDAGELVYLKDKHGNTTRDIAFTESVTLCTITDNVTKRVIARAEAPNDEEAFCRALALAHDAPMPKTPGEIEAENIKLKRRVAELEAGRAAVQAPDAPNESESESTEAGDEELAALREEAEMLGVIVDGRWGEKRLRKEIARAESEGQGEINEAMAKIPPKE